MTLKSQGDAIGVLVSLKRRERQSREAIVAHQTKKLREILQYANTIPYYRTLFDRHRIDPGSCTLDDLSKLPPLTKDLVRQNFDESVRQQHAEEQPLSYIRTSGSTGAPITVAVTSQEQAFRRGVLWYGASKAGVRLIDSTCRIGGFFEPLTHRTLSNRRTLLNTLGIGGRYVLDMRHDLDVVVDRLISLRPEVLISLPSYLVLLGQYLQERGRSLPSVRVILCGGEVLLPDVRQALLSAFRCRIGNLYSSFEFGLIAYECVHKRFHAIPDAAIIEVVDCDADQVGDALITSLYHKAMPLIRYQIGDRLKLSTGPCPCGVPFQTFRDVEGRSNDWLVLPSGKLISWRSVAEFRDIPGIKEYQVIQKRPDYVQVHLAKDGCFTEATITRIQERIKQGCLGEEVQVDVLVGEVSGRGRTGKLRVVISEVSVDHREKS